MVNNQAHLLSIIIPMFNEEQAIVRLLNELKFLQAYNVEIIVVDGGSTDSSVICAQSLADICISSAAGRAVQMNAGADVATGKWLWFLHADSQLPNNLPDWLQVLKNNNQIDWGFFKLQLSGKAWAFRVIEQAINCRSSFTSVATGDQGIFLKQSVFEQLSGFPEIPLMEDVAMSKSLRKKTRPKIWQNSLITSSRRWEEKGIIKTVLLMWSLRLAYFLGASPQQLSKFYR